MRKRICACTKRRVVQLLYSEVLQSMLTDIVQRNDNEDTLLDLLSPRSRRLLEDSNGDCWSGTTPTKRAQYLRKGKPGEICPGVLIHDHDRFISEMILITEIRIIEICVEGKHLGTCQGAGRFTPHIHGLGERCPPAREFCLTTTKCLICRADCGFVGRWGGWDRGRRFFF